MELVSLELNQRNIVLDFEPSPYFRIHEMHLGFFSQFGEDAQCRGVEPLRSGESLDGNRIAILCFLSGVFHLAVGGGHVAVGAPDNPILGNQTFDELDLIAVLGQVFFHPPAADGIEVTVGVLSGLFFLHEGLSTREYPRGHTRAAG